ncbi:hypothetical protein TcBrA4_0075850 [Trypanosoma cruzi]|nr:hypothetical protein TcBrA4_0075850 [Trypanosoma cruzi]
MTTERDELREHLAATSDDLGRQLRAVEQAKTEVEQSLEAVTTERDELREHLAARAMIWVGSCVLWSRAWSRVRRRSAMSCGSTLPPRAMIWVGSCVLWSRRRRRWSRAWRQ